MKYFKVRIVIGSSDGLFDIYYNSVDSNTRALIYETGLPATGLTAQELSNGDGILVSVPDDSTSIVLGSEPDAFCSNDPQVNNDSYSIPIGCYTYTVSSNSGVYNYQYTDCECNVVNATIDATEGPQEQTFCALYDSVISSNLVVTYVGGCSVTGIVLCYDETSAELACLCEESTEPLTINSDLFGSDTINGALGSWYGINSIGLNAMDLNNIPTGGIQLHTNRFGTHKPVLINDTIYNEITLTTSFEPGIYFGPYFAYETGVGSQIGWYKLDSTGKVIDTGIYS